jgi:hypothetical protein
MRLRFGEESENEGISYTGAIEPLSRLVADKERSA